MHCRGDFGRLGHGDIVDVFLPKPIRGLSGVGITRLACGDTHTLAVASNGRLFSFGRNQNGQLGIGTDKDSLSPVPVEALKVCCLHAMPMSLPAAASVAEGQVWLGQHVR